MSGLYDLERRWRQGQIHALRRIPRHWRLEVQRDWWPEAKRWLLALLVTGLGCLVLAALAA